MKAYKVVDLDLCSVTIKGDFAVQYRVGVKTFPRVAKTHLFVFKHLKDARLFTNESITSKIFECEVPRLFTMKYMSDFFGTGFLKKFWNKKFKHQRPSRELTALPPLGSYGTNWLTLIKEVK